jgi:hypothetical protein
MVSGEAFCNRESCAYTTLWESLTPSQRRVVKGLAAEAGGAKVLAGEPVVGRNLAP